MTSSVLAEIAGDAALGAAKQGLRGLKLLRQRRMRRLLGSLAHSDRTISLYIREMDRPDGRHTSRVPVKAGNPQQPQQLHAYRNIHEVYGIHDVRASVHILNLIAQAAKGSQVVTRSPNHDWDRWISSDVVSIGGHDVTWELLRRSRHPVTYIPLTSFEVEGGRRFTAQGSCDYGLICRGEDKTASNTFLVVVGIGGLATEAAALFLSAQAKTIAKLFPRSGFSIVLRASQQHGVGLAQPVWWWPEPSPKRKRVLWRAWPRWQGLHQHEIDCTPLPYFYVPGTVTTVPGTSAGPIGTFRFPDTVGFSDGASDTHSGDRDPTKDPTQGS